MPAKLIFENSGEIDIRLATIMGVNAKEGGNPIGFFGTGLKYAIACLCRWGEEITIQSGRATFTFVSEQITIRGKTFSTITMVGPLDSLQLGFTDQLGCHWKPWMVYRELWSNCQDEPGSKVYAAENSPAPEEGVTRVVVASTSLIEAHATRAEFILEPESKSLVCSTPAVDIYRGETKTLFYRGIAAGSSAKKMFYTYNVKQFLYLTEDRSTGTWQTDGILAKAIANHLSEAEVEKILNLSSEYVESGLVYPEGSDAWKTACAKLAFFTLPKSVQERNKPKKLCPTCGQAVFEVPF